MIFRARPMRPILLTLLLALVSVAASAGSLTAETDKNRMSLEDTVNLRLVAEGDLKGEPDLAPLSADFEILGQSSGSRMSIVNGAVSRTREWTLELSPRRTGRLTIPALSLGGQRTQPIAVEVTEKSPAAGGGPGPVRVQTEAEAKAPYVQQGFLYRVRLLFRVQPRRASLSAPTAEGAAIEQDGEDRQSTEMLDGQRYVVIERRFRVVPQRSGPLVIQGPRLEALLPEERASGARRSPMADFEEAFGGSVFQGFPNLADFGSGRRVVERGPDLTVQVRPQPPGTGPDWLPAQSVQLTDEWTPSPPRFRVGEPLTRTLVITAQGATASQLPTLNPGSPDGAKVYPEPPKLEDLPGSAAPSALKTLKVALVPTRAGPLTLPEIRLPWWDTSADRARVATIPQRTVQVEPAADGSTAMAAPPPQPVAPTSPRTDTEGERIAADRGALAAVAGSAGLWPWIALVLGLGWVATLVWLWRSRRAGRPTVASGGAQRRAETLRAAGAQLRQACLSGDPRAARTALLAWGRARWRGQAPRGLGALAMRLGDGEIGPILERIDRANYAAAADPWDGAAAWTALEPRLTAAERATAEPAPGPLPALYPPSV